MANCLENPLVPSLEKYLSPQSFPATLSPPQMKNMFKQIPATQATTHRRELLHSIITIDRRYRLYISTPLSIFKINIIDHDYRL